MGLKVTKEDSDLLVCPGLGEEYAQSDVDFSDFSEL